MTPDQTTRAGVDHTGPQSQTMQPQEPSIQAPQDPEPHDQEAQTPGASDASQPEPTQTAAEEIVMKCCGKTHENMRDCECRVPRGPCITPSLIFTHYSETCFCYSCGWLRDTKTSTIRSRIPGQEELEVENPTHAGNKSHTVLVTEEHFRTGLEAVHPVLLRNKPRQQWEWVYNPTGENRLPFMMSSSYCAGVLNVTMDSNGNWRANRANGTSFHISHPQPLKNELYTDYGYAPGYSPFTNNPNGDFFPLDPPMVNPQDYVAPKPPNQSREYSADRYNKTLFIGSIDCSLTKQEIRELFLNFGEITYVNKPHHSNAFVQFARRRDALMAMRQMQGVPIKTCRLRISWGDPKARNQSEIKEKNGWKPFKGHKYQHIQTKEKPQHANQNDWHPQSNPYGGFDMSGSWAQQQQYQMPQMAYAPVGDMSGPWYQQQQYQMPQMAYAPDGGMVWYPPQWHQYPYQQQMGCGYQHPVPPPPPPPPPPVGSAEQNSQPAPPESIPGNLLGPIRRPAGSHLVRMAMEHTATVAWHPDATAESLPPMMLETDPRLSCEHLEDDKSSLNPSVPTWVPPSTGNQKTKDPIVVSSDTTSHIDQQQGPVPRPDSTSSLESDQSKASSGTGQSRETTRKTSPGDEPRPTGDSETVTDIGEVLTRLRELKTSVERLTISMRKGHDTARDVEGEVQTRPQELTISTCKRRNTARDVEGEVQTRPQELTISTRNRRNTDQLGLCGKVRDLTRC